MPSAYVLPGPSRPGLGVRAGGHRPRVRAGRLSPPRHLRGTVHVLLDSLESVDADRIVALVANIEEYVPYLVVTLLPEEVQALDGQEYTVIETI